MIGGLIWGSFIIGKFLCDVSFEHILFYFCGILFYCFLPQAETKARSSSKIQSLFDADDDDEGMFGGTAEDIFAASPPQVKQKLSLTS